MSRLTRDKVTSIVGATPREIDRDLTNYRETANVLSADHPRLIDEYPQKWVGVYRGKVEAAAETRNALLGKLERRGIPKEKVIVRFIERERRTMIL